MAFSTSTYILQQQAGGQPSSTQIDPGFSSQHTFSTQSTRHQPYEPVGQAAHTTQTQDLAPPSQVLLSLHTEVQALEQKLDTSLRKNREYETSGLLSDSRNSITDLCLLSPAFCHRQPFASVQNQAWHYLFGVQSRSRACLPFTEPIQPTIIYSRRRNWIANWSNSPGKPL